MRCCDCSKYPFCSHIHKPSDEACEYAIKKETNISFNKE